MMLRNFFISNFRKVRILAGLLWGGVLLVSVYRGLSFAYVEPDAFTRKMWRDFYEMEENIDYIYIGSSHVYCGLNPEILDRRNGGCNFNLASGAQTLNNSYFLLREADREYELTHVYLELFYELSIEGNGNFDREDAIKIGWQNTDNMIFSYNKMDALYHLNTKDYYLDALFPLIRYRSELSNMKRVRDIIAEKKSAEYREYKVEGYTDKGFAYSAREMDNFLYREARRLEQIRMTDDAEEYLRKIIEYCQERQIGITLFSTPVYELRTIAIENYDNYIEQVKNIASEYRIPYYDFNIAREEFLPIQNKDFFSDAGHLNAKGAELFTNFFYEIVSSAPEDYEKYFYSSYSEMLKETASNVYGIYYLNGKRDETSATAGANAEQQESWIAHIASNRENGLEYRITLVADDGEENVWQDFSLNKVFYLPEGWKGLCRIDWRQTDGDEIRNMEVVFD